MQDTKTIRVSEETAKELDVLGKRGESYEDVIKRTINFTKKFSNEAQFTEWFKLNFAHFGFSDIVVYNPRTFPDFVLMRGGKEVKVELETISSNFIQHRHDPSKVDLVICILKDVDLPVETIEISAFEFTPTTHRILSLSPEIDRIVQNTRAKYLSQETPVDLSYTDVICMFVELGDAVLRNVASGGDQDIKAQIYRIVDEKIIEQYTT